MNYSQNNWIQLLSMAQLILNNRTVTATEKSLFYANYKYYPNLFKILRILLNIETVLKEISKFKKLYKEILRNIEY